MKKTKHVRLFFAAVSVLSGVSIASCGRRQGPGENLNSQVDTMISRFAKNDVAIESMQGDWLSQHPEKGQSFDQYRRSAKVYPGEMSGKIYVQPVGEFSPIQHRIIEQTARYLQLFFDRETVILPRVDDKEISTLVRRYEGTDEEQLKTGPVLYYLSVNFPEDCIIIMAITSKDLYPGEGWNFCFWTSVAKITRRRFVAILVFEINGRFRRLSCLFESYDQDLLARDESRFIVPALYPCCLPDERIK